MLHHIYVVDRFTLNMKNANRTKEIGACMWRMAFQNFTSVWHKSVIKEARNGARLESLPCAADFSAAHFKFQPRFQPRNFR